MLPEIISTCIPVGTKYDKNRICMATDYIAGRVFSFGELIMHVSVTKPSGAPGTRPVLSHSPPALAHSHLLCARLEQWCYKHKDKSPCLPAIAVPREREVTPPVVKIYRRAWVPRMLTAHSVNRLQPMSYVRQVRMVPVLLRRIAQARMTIAEAARDQTEKAFPSEGGRVTDCACSSSVESVLGRIPAEPFQLTMDRCLVVD